MALARSLTGGWFFTAPDGRRLFAPYGWAGRPFVVPDPGAEDRLARRYAAVMVGICAAAIVGVIVAMLADRDPAFDGLPVPEPGAFFGVLAGGVGIAWALDLALLRPAVRGLRRGTRREVWQAAAVRLAGRTGRELALLWAFLVVLAGFGVLLALGGARAVGLFMAAYAVAYAALFGCAVRAGRRAAGQRAGLAEPGAAADWRRHTGPAG